MWEKETEKKTLPHDKKVLSVTQLPTLKAQSQKCGINGGDGGGGDDDGVVVNQ